MSENLGTLQYNFYRYQKSSWTYPGWMQASPNRAVLKLCSVIVLAGWCTELILELLVKNSKQGLFHSCDTDFFNESLPQPFFPYVDSNLAAISYWSLELWGWVGTCQLILLPTCTFTNLYLSFLYFTCKIQLVLIIPLAKSSNMWTTGSCGLFYES